MLKKLFAVSMITLFATQTASANQNCEGHLLSSSSELIAMDSEKRSNEIKKLVDCALRSNIEAQNILSNIEAIRFDKVLNEIIAERDSLQKISDDRKIAIGQLENEIVDLRFKHDEATSKLLTQSNELALSKSAIEKHEIEKQNLNKVISELSLQILELNKKIVDINEHRQRLENEKKSQEALLAEKQKRINDQDGEIDRLKKSHIDQIRINDDKSLIIDQLTTERDIAIQTGKDRDGVIKELEKRLGETLLLLEKANNEVKRLEGEEARLVKLVQELNVEKDRLTLINKELDEKYRKLIVDHDKVTKDLDVSRKLIEELSIKNKVLDETVSNRNTENQNLKEDVKNCNQKLSVALADIVRLNETIEGLTKRVIERDKIVAELLDRVKELEAKNAELVSKNKSLEEQVDTLSNVRSEFFAKLKEKLKDQKGIRIVGDRFIIQSEILFDVGSPDLSKEGKNDIKEVAKLLKELSPSFPSGVNWVLQVNGHTDVQKIISGAKFASNWELSTARAVTVVKLMQSEGVEPNRLAAAGFGEHQPVDKGNSKESYSKNRRIELKLTDDGPY